jgi:hypothetical protein
MSTEPIELRTAGPRMPPWRRRWRTLASLLAALVILVVMIFTGLFGRTQDCGVDWSQVVVYLCGVVVVAAQADRLFHRTR